MSEPIAFSGNGAQLADAIPISVSNEGQPTSSTNTDLLGISSLFASVYSVRYPFTQGDSQSTPIRR
jgi:hypothetical protein